MFGKFHQGISLINGTENLLRGVFFIVVKDILGDHRDIHTQYKEHLNKIKAQKGNFIDAVSNTLVIV